MVGKKAVVRIIEAVIAIMLVLGALLMISSQREVKKTPDLSEAIWPILDEMVQNKTIRAGIKEYSLSQEYNSTTNLPVIQKIENFVKVKINNPSLNLSARICEFNATCFLEPLPDTDEDIYAVSRIVSSDIKESIFLPRKVKIFLWRVS